MDSEENKISKLNEMWINITEHLAHTAITLDKGDYGDNKIETLVVDLENKKNIIKKISLFMNKNHPNTTVRLQPIHFEVKHCHALNVILLLDFVYHLWIIS